MKLSNVAKLALSHLAAAVCAFVALKGNERVAERVGKTLGRRLAPVVNPLLTSASPARRTLGLVILIGAVVPTTYGVGAFGAASILGTFVGVEKLVTQLLADQDWSAIDELADSLAERKRFFAMQAALFGTVPAILQNLGLEDPFDAI